MKITADHATIMEMADEVERRPHPQGTIAAALDALEREPELIARVGELGRIGIKQEQRIAALEARLARVREEVARMRRAVEIMAGVESVAERVAQLRLVVARFDAALDGEGTK
jgi:hypothetical protein